MSPENRGVATCPASMTGGSPSTSLFFCLFCSSDSSPVTFEFFILRGERCVSQSRESEKNGPHEPSRSQSHKDRMLFLGVDLRETFLRRRKKIPAFQSENRRDLSYQSSWSPGLLCKQGMDQGCSTLSPKRHTTGVHSLPTQEHRRDLSSGDICVRGASQPPECTLGQRLPFLRGH